MIVNSLAERTEKTRWPTSAGLEGRERTASDAEALRRLEAAIPLYGHELNEDIDPFQAGLAWAVKMNKGDFIGREALAQRKEDPTRPIRVGLELEGK